MRSAFAHTDFSLLLQIRGIRNLILAGVVTDVCVFSTMKDACDKGLDCLLVRDACAAASHIHDAVVQSVEMEGGITGATASMREVNEVLNGWKAKAEEKMGIDMVEEIMRMAK
jgi:nicotinamidase-related amidase